MINQQHYACKYCRGIEIATQTLPVNFNAGYFYYDQR
jgi:hypothetical protein